MSFIHQDHIKQLQDGSIDYRYYSQRGCRMRNRLLRDFLQRLWRLPSKLIDNRRAGTDGLRNIESRVPRGHMEQV